MVHTEFDLYHPSIPALFLTAVLVFTFAVFHPVFLGISFCAAILYNLFLKGWRALSKSLSWQLPLLAIITLLNPLMNSSGSTVLFVWGGHHAFYLEALLYGLFMGLMLITVLLWFSNLTQVLTSDKIMQLTGSVLPTLGLMMTMTMRLVPQFVRRGNLIRSTQLACSSAGVYQVDEQGQVGEKASGTVKGAGTRQGWFARRVSGTRFYMRMVSVLMGWGMEDSLDTAQAMLARGWGAAKRSNYKRSSFRAGDGLMLALILALIVLSIIGVVVLMDGFAFYPTVGPLVLSWWYLPYGVLMFLPFILEAKGRILWRK